MLILATDTTGKALSVALVRDDRLIGEVRLNLGFNHAVTHAPQIEQLLRDCQIQVADIDLFACTRGPGSYTGTRIGLSTIKAMAYAAGKPAVGVSTLEAMAWPWRPLQNALICTLLDARNGRVFGAAYRAENLEPVIEPGNYLSTDFWTLLKPLIDQTNPAGTIAWLTGDGSASVASQVPAGYEQAARRLDPTEDSPRAASIALLAKQQFLKGDPGDPFSLDADYLSPAAAERLKNARNDCKSV